MILAGHAWIGEQVAQATGFRPYLPEWHPSLGQLDRDGQLVAGVLYHEFTRAAVQMVAARFGSAPLRRDFFRAIFDYPFNQLGCAKVLALVKSTNRHALQLDLRLGFIVEARIADWYPDGDQMILGMTRERCRFI